MRNLVSLKSHPLTAKLTLVLLIPTLLKQNIKKPKKAKPFDAEGSEKLVYARLLPDRFTSLISIKRKSLKKWGITDEITSGAKSH